MKQRSMLVLAGVAAVAIAMTALPGASAGRATAKPRTSATLKVTNQVIALAPGTNVGTSDGRVAGHAVHGGVRAQVTGSPSFTASGWLLYPTGGLRYVIHGQITPGPNGGRYDSGSGSITGGAGAFAGARGKLQFPRILIPAGAQTFTYTLTGKFTLP